MGKTYKNVLVAIDGSNEGKVAFEKAIDIAKKDTATLIITHVIDARSFSTLEHYNRSIAEEAESYGKTLVEEYEKEAKEAGVENVRTVLEFGSPKGLIPKDIATKNDVDLIVSGATGLNAVERFLIGSVSEAITRYASCDVLIVRNR